MDDKYAALRLKNQLCFPLYACSREVVKRYKPFLDKIDLTYTQYIAMMVFWEEQKINVKALGKKLFLDSGTLTPVLKSLEAKGLIRRFRCAEDERVLIAELTEQGVKLREQAKSVPQKAAGCMKLSQQEAMELYRLLYRILDTIQE